MGTVGVDRKGLFPLTPDSVVRFSQAPKKPRHPSGSRTASQTSQQERLEPRLLAAADGDFAIWHQLADESEFAIADTSSVAALGSSSQDSAGSTLDSAVDFGRIDGLLQRHGKLAANDQLDLVRFDVTHKSDVQIQLDRLTGSADLYVLDERGHFLTASRRSGTQSDQVMGTLPAGTYYLAILANQSQEMFYRLSIDVQPISSNTAPLPLQWVDDVGGARQWNIDRVAAPEAWAQGYEGQGITIAVVDSGVDLDHPELGQQFYVNRNEIPGNGLDDDANGFVDDVMGYDFIDGDARPDDPNGHGTHVAGIIAANGTNVQGVAPKAKILPVRVLDRGGQGSDQSVAAGIRYAADMGASIINLSLGGSYSPTIANAVHYAVVAGSLVVAAAGNEGASTPTSPAILSSPFEFSHATGVISVGAFNQNDELASFSNRVGDSQAIQVDAPGVNILSTYSHGRYALLSGSSAASPHVSGLAALMLSANPRLTSAQLKWLLASYPHQHATASDSHGIASARYSVAYAMAGYVPSANSLQHVSALESSRQYAAASVVTQSLWGATEFSPSTSDQQHTNGGPSERPDELLTELQTEQHFTSTTLTSLQLQASTEDALQTQAPKAPLTPDAWFEELADATQDDVLTDAQLTSKRPRKP